MSKILEFLRARLATSIAGGVALLIFGAIVIGGTVWSNSVTVEDVTARVLEVGPGHSETYQCGSTQVGKVSSPRYCTRTEYTVEFAIAGTDETMRADLTSTPSLGSEIAAYKVIDSDSYSYELYSPQSAMFVVMMLVIALLVGLLGGLIAFFIADHFVGFQY
jgi:hypothetical protein